MRLDIRRSKDGSRRQSDTDKEVDLMRRELERTQKKMKEMETRKK